MAKEQGMSFEQHLKSLSVNRGMSFRQHLKSLSVMHADKDDRETNERNDFFEDLSLKGNKNKK